MPDKIIDKPPEKLPKRQSLAYWVLPGNLLILEQFARSGMNKEQIANIIGISYHTLDKWASKDERVSSALKNAPQDAVAAVESALYRKAMGYNAPVRKGHKVRRVEYDPETGKKLREWDDIVVVEEEVHVPASDVAEIFFLRNRAKYTWSNNPEATVQAETDTAEGGVVMLPPVGDDQHDVRQDQQPGADIVRFIQSKAGNV